MRPTRWRRSTHVLVGVGVLLAVAVLVTVAAVFVAGGPRTSEAQAVDPQPEPAAAEPAVYGLDESAPKPVPPRLSAVIGPFAADPNLGRLTGRITDAATGEELWERGASVPMQPASTNKLLTAAAALLALDRDSTLTTTVLADPDEPGVVVLKGGGDPTLSAAAPKTTTWYRNAARITDLAAQVRRSGVTPRTVRVDLSAYSGPTMAPGWDPLDIQNGDIAPIESVMLDGGRTQPVSVESRRSTTPALDAGRALAVALGVNPRTVGVLPSPLR
ncbi:MAG: dacB 3, partial [Mycobacterium sp.]|nr:dacB 3 [Mycobacterium sp.]